MLEKDKTETLSRHGGDEGGTALGNTRHMLAGFLGYFVFLTLHVGFHSLDSHHEGFEKLVKSWLNIQFLFNLHFPCRPGYSDNHRPESGSSALLCSDQRFAVRQNRFRILQRKVAAL